MKGVCKFNAKKLIYAVVFLLVLNIYFLYHTIFGKNGFYGYVSSQEKLAQLQKNISANDEKILHYSALYEAINSGKIGDSEIEIFIKENYDYAKVGERVVIID